MLKEEVIEDIKSLGGFWLYVLITFVLYNSYKVRYANRLAIALIAAFAIIIFIRAIYFKARPVAYKHKTWLDKIDASSFPSMHATRAAILAVVLSIYFSTPLLSGVFAFCAFGVAAARVVGKKHFAFDVAAGLALGGLIGYAVIVFV